VVLDATPCAALTFLTTRTGRPYSGSDFSDEFRKWCDAAALPKSCTAHGLRKTAACRLVNDGATTHQIAAMTGHASLSEVQRYTKAADQARLAREAVALRQRRAEQTKSESEVANLSRRFANGSKKL
jgi:integrase